MPFRKLLIIADEQHTASLEASLQLNYGHNLKTLTLPEEFFNPHLWTYLKRTFDNIAAFLKEEYKPRDLRKLTVLIADTVELPQNKINDKKNVWNPLHYKNNGENHHREMVYAWLILVFPEIRFVFYGSPQESDKKENKKKSIAVNPDLLHLYPKDNYETIQRYLIETDFPVLFDPSGLRNRIRKFLEPPEKKYIVGCWNRLDSNNAVTIEDEPSFAYSLGYAAYRSGCRTWVVQNFSQARYLLKPQWEKDKDGNVKKDEDGKDVEEKIDVKFKLSLEDLRLGFFDKEKAIHLQKINGDRDKSLPLLAKAEHRFIVTYGQTKSGDEQSLQDQIVEYNEKYHGKSKMRRHYKPLAGLFDLQDNTISKANIDKSEDTIDTSSEKDSVGHSAEGMILEMNSILTERARRLLEIETPKVSDTVHAALLALEAKELLQSKTPSKSFAAVALQHRAEAMMECVSYGNDYELNVQKRIEDIKGDVHKIARHYRDEKHKHLAVISTGLRIVGDLSAIYKEYMQIEEYEQCVAETRRLARRSYVRHHPWIYYSGINLIWKYIQFLQQSLWNFSRCVVAWFVFYGILWWITFHGIPKKNDSINCLECVAMLFFTRNPKCIEGTEMWFSFMTQVFTWNSNSDNIQAFACKHWYAALLIICVSIFSVSHIAVLITMMYERIQRK